MRNMRRIPVFLTLLGAVSLVGLMAFSSTANADDCRLGCNYQKRACVKAAKVRFLAAKERCNAEHKMCFIDCAPNDCVAACGLELEECARRVFDQARECLRGCRHVPLAQKLACLAECADLGERGAEVCLGNFRSCLRHCSGGSPSGAFLEPTSDALQ